MSEDMAGELTAFSKGPPDHRESMFRTTFSDPGLPNGIARKTSTFFHIEFSTPLPPILPLPTGYASLMKPSHAAGVLAQRPLL